MATHFLIIALEIIILLGGFVGLWFYQKRMVSNNTKYTELYSDYLHSRKWEALRKTALVRADHQCELCNAPYKAVHHIKYPKKYKEDHIDNLLVVCDQCHAKLHGIRDEQIIEASENCYLEEVKTGSHRYSFQVIQAVNGKKCLRIIESGKRGERQIEIMEDNIEKFANNMSAGFASLNNGKLVQFSEKLLTGYLTYFFEIKSAVNDSKYLKVTESRRKDNATFEQNPIIIFDDEAKLFSIGLDNAINFIMR
jgi:hypothetical protein